MATALKLTAHGHDISLTAEQHEMLTSAGVTTDLLTQFVKLFGPKVADILINLIIKKQTEVKSGKFKGILDIAGVDYLRNLLADALREYKASIGAAVEAWVEQGIEALASVVDTQ